MRHFSGSGLRESHGCEYDQINDKHVKMAFRNMLLWLVSIVNNLRT